MYPLPSIDLNLCNGCGVCVELCPTQALVSLNAKAVLAHPDKCTYCSACEDACPEAAIALPFLVVVASSKRPGHE
jgi:formate hydrogenlyase subunit 6/NADH:ubiquinone oxidoreductase subunit I